MTVHARPPRRPSPLARAALLAAGLALPLAGFVGHRPALAGDLPADLTGYYRGSGITTESASGLKRRIRGTLLVSPAEGGYELRFSFKTAIASADGDVRADLIGTGEATREGDALAGTSETQIIMAAIPGIDPQFAFIPGRLGPRIRSTFEMRASDEPEVFRAEVETIAVPGFEYASTRTTLRLERISSEAPQDERLPLPLPHDD